jgi:competence/damage-inducible protein CinA-like protein
MPSAEIITIGTELLLGEIQDTNTRYLAKKFKENNIDLFRITMIGDNANRISELVEEALSRSDIVITTGGLGPTVDDPTRDAIALAVKTQTEFHPDLWQEIEQRFLHRSQIPTENNKRQAYLPIGAIVIHNPVGTAPAFYFLKENKIIISLPGVPREMEYLTENEVLPLLKRLYHLKGIIKPRVIHIAGMGESVVDSAIEDFERYTNPTVGLLAHPGVVDIRITAKAESEEEADEMILAIENQIVPMFPNKVFGYDNESLIGAVEYLAKQNNTSITVKVSGLSEIISKEINDIDHQHIVFMNFDQTIIPLQTSFSENDPANIQVAGNFRIINNESQLKYNVCTKNKVYCYTNVYNGPSTQGALWALNITLESIRQILLELYTKGNE